MGFPHTQQVSQNAEIARIILPPIVPSILRLRKPFGTPSPRKYQRVAQELGGGGWWKIAEANKLSFSQRLTTLSGLHLRWHLRLTWQIDLDNRRCSRDFVRHANLGATRRAHTVPKAGSSSHSRPRDCSEYLYVCIDITRPAAVASMTEG
jgi:hypothetical protein